MTQLEAIDKHFMGAIKGISFHIWTKREASCHQDMKLDVGSIMKNIFRNVNYN